MSNPPKDYIEPISFIARIAGLNQFIPVTPDTIEDKITECVNVINGSVVKEARINVSKCFFGREYKKGLKVTWLGRAGAGAATNSFFLTGEELDKFLKLMEMQSQQYQA